MGKKAHDRSQATVVAFFVAVFKLRVEMEKCAQAVIPAQAGILLFLSQWKLDASFRWHDGFTLPYSLPFKA